MGQQQSCSTCEFSYNACQVGFEFLKEVCSACFKPTSLPFAADHEQQGSSLIEQVSRKTLLVERKSLFLPPSSFFGRSSVLLLHFLETLHPKQANGTLQRGLEGKQDASETKENNSSAMTRHIKQLHASYSQSSNIETYWKRFMSSKTLFLTAAKSVIHVSKVKKTNESILPNRPRTALRPITVLESGRRRSERIGNYASELSTGFLLDPSLLAGPAAKTAMFVSNQEATVCRNANN